MNKKQSFFTNIFTTISSYYASFATIVAKAFTKQPEVPKAETWDVKAIKTLETLNPTPSKTQVETISQPEKTTSVTLPTTQPVIYTSKPQEQETPKPRKRGLWEKMLDPLNIDGTQEKLKNTLSNTSRYSNNASNALGEARLTTSDAIENNAAMLNQTKRLTSPRAATKKRGGR